VTYVTNVRRTAAWAVGAIVGIVALIGLLGAVLAPHLPVGIDQDVAPSAFGPDLVGEPALLVCQAVGLIVYAIAALGFARRAERGGDELMSWLAAGSTLAAFARLNYFLFPSINSEWVYTGDFLRVGFYVLVLIGALREISAYQRELAELAVHRERRRIARELHDGLAQELAFISSHARRSSTQADASMSRIADAAARALDESRQAIATLARPVDASLDRSVAQAAHEVAARHGLDVTLELAPGVRAADATHDALMRIVREAIHNAARHGGASTVTVGLAVSDGVRLTVEDDGKGLRAHARNGAGFGLVSMRERAEALGGTLELRAAERGGVRVEVELP
jgi:signal transduction histidine kinase